MTTKTKAYDVKLRKLEDIRPYERNPRINDGAVDAVAASMQEFGFRQRDPEVAAALLNVHQVARLLSCSPRHVHRLVSADRMPRPVKLGALVRWPRHVIEAWIEEGCPKFKNRP